MLKTQCKILVDYNIYKADLDCAQQWRDYQRNSKKTDKEFTSKDKNDDNEKMLLDDDRDHDTINQEVSPNNIENSYKVSDINPDIAHRDDNSLINEETQKHTQFNWEMFVSHINKKDKKTAKNILQKMNNIKELKLVNGEVFINDQPQNIIFSIAFPLLFKEGKIYNKSASKLVRILKECKALPRKWKPTVFKKSSYVTPKNNWWKTNKK